MESQQSGPDPGWSRPADPHARWIGDRDVTQWRTELGRWLVEVAGRLSERFGAWVPGVLLMVIGAAVTLPLVAASGEVYEAVAERDDLARLDQPVLDWAVSTRTEGLSEAVTFYTDLGGPIMMPVIATVATLLLAWRRHSWVPIVVMLCATGGSLLFTVVGKDLIGRLRPPQSLAVPPYESSASFPSGHTLNSTVIAGTLVYLALPLVKAMWGRAVLVLFAAAWAVSMGLSRVWLGHHWLTDVVFAWFLGLAWLTVVITAHRLYLTLRHGSWRTPK